MNIALFNTATNSIPPSNYGGSQNVTYITGVSLAERGHNVYMFAPPGSKFDEGELISLNKGWGRSNEETNVKILERYIDKIDALIDTTAYTIPSRKWKDLPYLARMGGDPHKRYCGFCDRNWVWPSYSHFQFHNKYESQGWCECSKKRHEMFGGECEIYVRHSIVHKPFSFWNISKDENDIPFQDEKEDWFLTLGLIAPHKGTHLAVEFAHKAKVPLKIYGPINDQNYFDSKIKPYLSNKITYHGSIGGLDKYKLFSKAQGTLFTTDCEEGLPNVPLESMSTGTPVIGFNRSTITEIVDHCKNGLLYNSVDDMVKNYQKIDIINRKTCRESVFEKFSIKTFIDKYEDLIQRVVSGERWI